MTRARQRRIAAVFASAQLASIGAVATGAGPTREAWAAGIALPGGGHLYNRVPPRFAATAAAFGLTGVLWFGTGIHVAPPLVSAAPRPWPQRAPVAVPAWRGAPFVVGAAVAATAFELVRERRQQFKEQKAQAAPRTSCSTSPRPVARRRPPRRPRH